MKRLFIIFLFAVLMLPSRLFAEETETDIKVYFWFYVKLGEMFNNETETSYLKIKKIGKEVFSGSYDEFIKSHKAGLKTGRIFIGPFSDIHLAHQAKREYETARVQTENVENILSKGKRDTIYYFYLSRPVIGKWFNPVHFQRIPARISGGTRQEFQAMLTEGFSFRFLAIGPFVDYGMAEKSKFIFRKNGEETAAALPDSTDKSIILKMDKKWKSVKVDIVRLPGRKNQEIQAYRLKIRFPKQYFSENVFQTLTFKAKYSDNQLDEHTGITLQGELVADNNPMIPFQKSTTFSHILEFPVFKNIKLAGFYIESFIFSNAEMLEQEKRYLPVR